jgi:hypothetical protein
MNEEEERRQWACPPGTGTIDGINLEILDRSDPDQREFLTGAEHPELRQALNDDVEEIELHGQAMSPRLHMTLHRVVLNQLWDGEPPEAWQTVKRLRGLGYERHEILHMLMNVMAKRIWRTLEQEGGPPNHPRTYAAELDDLPESWEAQRPNPARKPRPQGKSPKRGGRSRRRK